MLHHIGALADLRTGTERMMRQHDRGFGSEAIAREFRKKCSRRSCRKTGPTTKSTSLVRRLRFRGS